MNNCKTWGIALLSIYFIANFSFADYFTLDGSEWTAISANKCNQ